MGKKTEDKYIELVLKENEYLKEKLFERTNTIELEKMIVTLQKVEIHNQVLLMTILSQLGMKDKEIDKLNKRIVKNLEEMWEEHCKE